DSHDAVGVEPSFAGPDLRTLECPKCELAYKALAEGPMKPSTKRAGSNANQAGGEKGRLPGRPLFIPTPALLIPPHWGGVFVRSGMGAASTWYDGPFSSG